MAAVTYPGTVNPLRGLNPFTESEREVLFGRDEEREELSRLVSGEGFRAGLLYGEPGVGKTSLLRAGVVPHLRDHGVIALVCENTRAPIDSLATALTNTGGATPAPNEQNLSFLARVVGGAMAGQLYLFIVDEAESVLEDDHVVSELGDMFARVIARSGGRARFLFSCSSHKVHLFGKLERRTGSLFPPSSRYELRRFEPSVGAAVLERTLSFNGLSSDVGLAMAALGQDSHGVLPADVQIAALAIRDLGLRQPAEIARLGGPSELERVWLSKAAASTGNERSALRLLAELAHGEGNVPVSPETAAARASLDPAWARTTLSALEQRGIVRPVAVRGEEGFHYLLSHDILAPRLRQIAAPARLAARRAFELLGSKAAQNRRLSLPEWWAVYREGLTPTTPAERAVIDRTRRLARIVGAVAVGVPLFILIVVYIAMAGSFYLDVSRSDAGVETVVVRKGRSGLSAFDWLPASPSFGSIIADTGYRRTMIDPDKWEQITDHDVSGSGSEYVDLAAKTLDPQLRNLTAYATDGSESVLDALIKAAQTPEQRTALLEGLLPIGRGGPKEVALVEQSLLDPSPSVQTAALTLAAETAKRRSEMYQDTLARALTSADGELRRLAFSAARALGPKLSRDLFTRALAQNPEGAARQELAAVVTTTSSEETMSAATAAAVLANRTASQPARERARDRLRRSFRTDPAGATLAASRLVADPKAAIEDKQLAFDLMLDHAPKESYPQVVEALREVMALRDEALRAAALPLYARVSPEAAAGELALMLSNQEMSEPLRVAMALAWGEVARAGTSAAQGALEVLIKDRRPDVRAAAASAYGYIGRAAQDELNKMIKKERYDVAVGAMLGLAHSAETGGNINNAVYGIAQMWKKKGRPRREAARVYAVMARTKPAAVMNYVASAAHMNDDASLHPIGVDGLCNAIAGGYKRAASDLVRAAGDGSPDVRRRVIECVADYPDDVGTAIRIASKLATDRDAEIRVESARVLAAIVGKGEPTDEVKQSLIGLARDDVREVRVIAMTAIAALGAGAPDEAKEVLPRAFSVADESEKLVILDAAQAIGAGGLVQLAMADESPLVREGGLDTAIATASQVPATLNSALTDPDPGLRRAALQRLAQGKHGLGSDDVDRALGLAIRDRDESIRDMALTTLAQLGELAQVKARLAATVGSRSERERARAAAALAGLTERKPKDAAEMLEPLLEDPSHDVREAMLPALAAAWAKVHPPEELGQLLRKSEKHATRRLVATAAFVVIARTDPGQAVKVLEQIADDGPPLARHAARLGLGLIGSSADGVSFLASLTP